MRSGLSTVQPGRWGEGFSPQKPRELLQYSWIHPAVDPGCPPFTVEQTSLAQHFERMEMVGWVRSNPADKLQTQASPPAWLATTLRRRKRTGSDSALRVAANWIAASAPWERLRGVSAVGSTPHRLLRAVAVSAIV